MTDRVALASHLHFPKYKHKHQKVKVKKKKMEKRKKKEYFAISLIFQTEQHKVMLLSILTKGVSQKLQYQKTQRDHRMHVL